MDREKNAELYDELLMSNKRVENFALKIEKIQTRIEYLNTFIKMVDDIGSEVDELAFDENNKNYYTALNRAGTDLFSVLQSCRREQHSLKTKYLEECKNFNAYLKRYKVYYPYNQGYEV